MIAKRLFIFLLLLIVSTSLHAQRFNKKGVYDDLRHGQWEAALLVQGSGGTEIEGENGSSIEIDDSFGWGFNIGWNMNANWNFSYKFTMNQPDYAAVIVPEAIEGEDPVPPREIDYQLDKYSHAFNATWHWFKGPLTPFLQAGIGYTTIDSGIPSQPPQTGCWWDPWWGYICDTYWKTYDTGDFAYNVGLGIRWDVNGALFFRGSYNREFFKVDSGSLDFDTITVDMGLMF